MMIIRFLLGPFFRWFLRAEEAQRPARTRESRLAEIDRLTVEAEDACDALYWAWLEAYSTRPHDPDKIRKAERIRSEIEAKFEHIQILKKELDTDDSRRA